MILLIDNYDSFTFNLVHLLQQCGASVCVKRHDEITIPAIYDLRPTAIVISPGPGNPEQAGICLGLVREFSGKLPLLGVCLGHQCLVQAFGGKIVRSKRIMHGKTSQIFHDGRGIFSGIPSPFLATRYHSLVAEDATLPDCFEVSGRVDDDTIMGVRHKNHPSVGLQFHPESVLTQFGHDLMSNFLKGRI